jgi:hypothetical protein
VTRSDALEPLSHDHHEALAFAATLRRAQRAGNPPEPFVADVEAFWRDHLVPHFEDEEAFVLPVLAGGAPALAARMVGEHGAIRALVDAVGAEPPAWDGPLGSVADTIAAHVRFEEREAFPAAERLASTSALARLGTQIHHAHRTRTP